MTSPPIIVRPLTSPPELGLHFQMARQAFFADASPASVLRWQQFVLTLPEYRKECIRGAFRDNEQLGSYVIYERTLRMGMAQLVTGCIAAVVTYPAYRHQGVATMLMHDAIDYAQSRHYTLLLLDGIPHFYDRFGYHDIYDMSTQDIDRAAILAQPSSTHLVRSAYLHDAHHVLALYHRHCGAYTGSFKHSILQQIHRLEHRSSNNPLWLAISPTNSIEGYLYIKEEPDFSQAQELAADNWPATLALLQHHARITSDSTTSLRYRLAPTSPTLLDIIDHLQLTDRATWETTTEEGVVCGYLYAHDNAGWMARPVHFPTLIQALLPEWQARWKRSLSYWIGHITLKLAEYTFSLSLDGTTLQLTDLTTDATNTLKLTSQHFTALLFGYRPVAWVALQSEQHLDGDVLSALNILFPVGHCWIPPTDWF